MADKEKDETQAAGQGKKPKNPTKKPPTIRIETDAEGENHAAGQEKRTTGKGKGVSAADKPSPSELMFTNEQEQQPQFEENQIKTISINTALAERLLELTEPVKKAAEQWAKLKKKLVVPMPKILQAAIKASQKSQQELLQLVNSEAFQTQYNYNSVVLPKNAAAKKKAAETGEALELQPDSDFIGLALAEYQERGELQEVTVAEIIKESYTEAAERTDSDTYTELLKKATALYAEYDKNPAAFDAKYEAELEQKTATKKVTAKRVTKQDFPLDKVNTTAWRTVTENPDGQYTAAYATLKDQKQIGVLYSLNFIKLKGEGTLNITKKLTPYDRRVYNAIGALFNGGNEVFSLSQIYPLMGYSGRPGKDDIKKIHNSVIKMLHGSLTVDNTPEHTATNGKYTKFTYTGTLLPIEIITAEINGQVTDCAIHVFREPPLISFARERKQITTIQSRLLQTGLSNTENNILLTDYLIEYIGALKRPKSQLSDKLTLETIYKNCGITTKNQKTRAPEKIKTILTGFKDKAFIKNFTLTKEAVTFNV